MIELNCIHKVVTQGDPLPPPLKYLPLSLQSTDLYDCLGTLTLQPLGEKPRVTDGTVYASVFL